MSQHQIHTCDFSAGMGIQAEEAETVLESVGFNAEMRQKPIASLSGGWKMKLALGADLYFRHTLLCGLSRDVHSFWLHAHPCFSHGCVW